LIAGDYFWLSENFYFTGMKTRVIIIFVLAIAISPLASAQIDQSMPQSLSEIIFYRTPGSPGPAGDITIYSNKQPVLDLKYGKFARYITQPGDYVFSAGIGNPSIVRILAEPGKVYYIKCDYIISLWYSKTAPVLMDHTAGQTDISKYGITEQPPAPFVQKVRRSRLGLMVGFGFGFESIPLFLLQNGDEVTLSAGGGFSLGAQYAFDINRKLNLSLDCFYEGSTLSTSLSNGDGTFDRMGITLTPAYIIPIKGGMQYRIMAGAGAGIYCFGSMFIDQSQMPGGEKYTLKYSPAFGLHLSMVFHAKFTEKTAMSIGIKYYNVQYSFTEEGSTHTTINPEFRNPDGSGFDIILGYHLNF
jgi:hypothetical protein